MCDHTFDTKSTISCRKGCLSFHCASPPLRIAKAQKYGGGGTVNEFESKGRCAWCFFLLLLCRPLGLKLAFTARGNWTQGGSFFLLSSIVRLPRVCRIRPFWCTCSTDLSSFFGLSPPPTPPPAFKWGWFLEGGHLSGPLPKWKIVQETMVGYLSGCCGTVLSLCQQPPVHSQSSCKPW